jgi:hypothetical protein
MDPKNVESLKMLARLLFPSIMDYYNSEEGQREFEEWKANNTEKDDNKTTSAREA